MAELCAHIHSEIDVHTTNKYFEFGPKFVTTLEKCIPELFPGLYGINALPSPAPKSNFASLALGYSYSSLDILQFEQILLNFECLSNEY